MGVWLTTFKSCLWLYTSHSSGSTLKSPTRMVGLSSCAEKATIRSRKLIFCPNLGFSVRSGISPPSGPKTDRKSVEEGKRVSARVYTGGRHLIKKNTH